MTIADKTTRTFQAPDLFQATAQLTHLGNQRPYFSVICDHGADHGAILAHFPEIAGLVALHLSDETGAPMHAVANARYFTEQGNAPALARHLRIAEPEAAALVADPTPDAIARAVDALRPRWQQEADAAREFLTLPDSIAPTPDPSEFAPESLLIELDGNQAIQIDESDIDPHGYLPLLTVGSREYHIAESSEEAGAANREYWQDMAKNDPTEFAAIVGEETLVKWALGQSAGPGSQHVDSLDGWFDLTAEHPEEQFASYDGEERAARVNAALAEELGFTASAEWLDVVVYRAN